MFPTQEHLSIPLVLEIAWFTYDKMTQKYPQKLERLHFFIKNFVLAPGMQIHIRPVARGDKNYVRAIVNQHVTSPAGD